MEHVCLKRQEKITGKGYGNCRQERLKRRNRRLFVKKDRKRQKKTKKTMTVVNRKSLKRRNGSILAKLVSKAVCMKDELHMPAY